MNAPATLDLPDAATLDEREEGKKEGVIQKLSVRHDAIMDYMLANPQIKLKDVAKHFEMTQAWMSQVIHSEAFQAALAIKQDALFHSTVLPIREKLHAVAHIGLDKILDNVGVMPVKEVAQVTQDALDRLGFSPKTPLPPPSPPGAGTTVNVHLNLRNDLMEARKLIGAIPATKPADALEVQLNGQTRFISLSPQNAAAGGPPVVEGAICPREAENSGAEERLRV